MRPGEILAINFSHFQSALGPILALVIRVGTAFSGKINAMESVNL